jgi:protocatechuate 3,4-dioxygenase beta subunit
MTMRAIGAAVAVLVSATLLGRAQGPQQPARDTPAQQQQAEAAPTPTGRITGRVLAGDTGRPVRRARVQIRAQATPGGRAVLTDDNGVFDFTGLPADHYTVAVSKTGFVALQYGQRRPLQPGTPLQLGEGQELRGIEFHLPPGGVITGHLFDDSGEPVPGAVVRVLRYRYVQGERQLVPAGTGQTDDRGEFRVWGLDPGQYYVNAVTRLFDLGVGSAGPGGRGGRGGRGGFAGALAGAAAALGGANAAALFEPIGDDGVNYAPTYFPGVASPNEAQPLTLGVSQQLENINFNLLLVPTARISGHVMTADGDAATSGFVSVSPEGAPGGGRGRGGLGSNYGSRIEWDGAFDIANVPPGRYTLRATTADRGVDDYATIPLTVAGADIPDLVVLLQPGATIAGTVRFENSLQAAPSDLSRMRLMAAPLDRSGFGGRQPAARVQPDGTFTLESVPAGDHLIREGGGLRGWTLKSVTLNGREITDTPLTLRGGENVTGVVVVFTDRITELSGTVTDQSGNPMTDFTVLAFPTDARLWRPNARQIMTARPDQNGAYQIHGLPPGDYYVAPVDPSEPGEWFDPEFLEAHREDAAHVVLGEGESRTEDFHVSLR